jgi:hypothetical protein
MSRTAARRTRLGLAFAGLLLVSACGGEEPEALEPMEPEVPANLCAMVPGGTKSGLVANANSDETGNPTAACSLRSADPTSGEVRAVITWVQLNDDVTADTVLDSQCRSIDRTEYQEQAGFAAKGAQRACAASSKAGGADAATMAGVADREVVTVRYTSSPPGRTPSIQVAQQMLEGVLASMAG